MNACILESLALKWLLEPNRGNVRQEINPDFSLVFQLLAKLFLDKSGGNHISFHLSLPLPFLHLISLHPTSFFTSLYFITIPFLHSAPSEDGHSTL
jgi:hypothetical protein